MASVFGPFPGYEKNKKHMLRVMRNHRLAAYNADATAYEGIEIKPVGIDPKYCPDYLLKAATSAWDEALQLGEQYGYRNAQATVIAPTGTIGLLMDCDTTGVEPDFALVKFKKLSGGGYFKIVNECVPAALENLGYTPAQIDAIVKYAKGNASFVGCPHVNHRNAERQRLYSSDLEKIEAQLPSAFDISFAFNVFSSGRRNPAALGFTAEQYKAPNFNLLRELGFAKAKLMPPTNMFAEP